MITKWLVEYSVQQKCCHVDTAHRCCELNVYALERGDIPEFTPVASFDSREQAEQFAIEFTEEMFATKEGMECD